MTQKLAMLTFVVRDYDEAIEFFTGKMRFSLVEDTMLGEGKRWVRVEPPGGQGAGLLLARAKNQREREAIGDQTGGRVFLFLQTDDFARDHKAMSDAGIRFVEMPRQEPYGTVAVFLDLYGNRWDLIELKAPA